MDKSREQMESESPFADADGFVRGGMVACSMGHPARENGEPCGPCDDEAAAGFESYGHDEDWRD